MDVMIFASVQRGPVWLAAAARLGLAAWFFGNLYEGIVGVPQLLADARERRSPGLLRIGSPVRFFAPVALLAFGATIGVLVTSLVNGGDRYLITTVAVSLAVATALTVYLVRTVNVRLLFDLDKPLGKDDRRRMFTTWHTANAVRVIAVAVAIASFTSLTS